MHGAFGGAPLDAVDLAVDQARQKNAPLDCTAVSVCTGLASRFFSRNVAIDTSTSLCFALFRTATTITVWNETEEELRAGTCGESRASRLAGDPTRRVKWCDSIGCGASSATGS